MCYWEEFFGKTIKLPWELSLMWVHRRTNFVCPFNTDAVIVSMFCACTSKFDWNKINEDGRRGHFVYLAYGPIAGRVSTQFLSKTSEWYLNSIQFPPSEYYSRDDFVCLSVFLSTAMIQTHMWILQNILRVFLLLHFNLMLVSCRKQKDKQNEHRSCSVTPVTTKLATSRHTICVYL